jgi:hypothetical protein
MITVELSAKEVLYLLKFLSAVHENNPADNKEAIGIITKLQEAAE